MSTYEDTGGCRSSYITLDPFSCHRSITCSSWHLLAKVQQQQQISYPISLFLLSNAHPFPLLFCVALIRSTLPHFSCFSRPNSLVNTSLNFTIVLLLPATNKQTDIHHNQTLVIICAILLLSSNHWPSLQKVKQSI